MKHVELRASATDAVDPLARDIVILAPPVARMGAAAAYGGSGRCSPSALSVSMETCHLIPTFQNRVDPNGSILKPVTLLRIGGKTVECAIGVIGPCSLKVTCAFI
ncbi:hypothetical protein [Paraburkholderia ferrariae]|uniref:Uncharacterized protein n=1 Tax=Paraburkholderia ferrariae TaxID=386056 RepID=A0ABU9S346_9BURK